MSVQREHVLANYVVEPYKNDKDRFRLTTKFENEMRKAKVKGKIDHDEVKMLIWYNYNRPANFSN